MSEKTAKPRKTRAPRLKTARAAYDKARSELARARKKGDAAATATAAAALETATGRLAAANLDRFEQIVSMRISTACNAVEEIIKLANQRRYVIDEHHAGAILDMIGGAVVNLQTALNAAVARGKQPPARRAIVFGARDNVAGGNGGDHEGVLTPIEQEIEHRRGMV